MKEKNIIELKFILTSPVLYYFLLLFALFGGWKVGQDLYDILTRRQLLSDIVGTYVGLIVGSVIALFIVRRRAKKILARLER